MYVEDLVLLSMIVAVMMFCLHFTDPPKKKETDRERRLPMKPRYIVPTLTFLILLLAGPADPTKSCTFHYRAN